MVEVDDLRLRVGGGWLGLILHRAFRGQLLLCRIAGSTTSGVGETSPFTAVAGYSTGARLCAHGCGRSLGVRTLLF